MNLHLLRSRHLFVALLCWLCCSLALAASSPRQRDNFNRDWRFAFSASDATPGPSKPRLTMPAGCGSGPLTASAPYFGA